MKMIPNQFEIVHKRIQSLPASQQRFISTGGIMPNLPSREYGRKARIAKALTVASGGAIEVMFTGCMFDDDDASYGHLFHANPNTSAEWDQITLDDRQPNLHSQLAAELRRIATEYLQIAARFEAHGAEIH